MWKMLAVLLLALPCMAQESFVKQERILLPTYLASQAIDAYATDRGFESGTWHEHNPLVPANRAARIAYFSATAGLVVGTAWLFHKTHHYKLERIALISGIVTESYASASSIHGLR